MRYYNMRYYALLYVLFYYYFAKSPVYILMIWSVVEI